MSLATVRKEKLKVSQVGLARGCGVTPGAVSRWESGGRPPDIEKIHRYAESIGVQLTAEDFVAILNTHRSSNQKAPHDER